MDRASRRPNGWHGTRVAGALALAALNAACAFDATGYAITLQDKYDLMTCKEIVASRAGLVAREKDLSGLIEKAESSPGGIIASYSAYRSEHTAVRGQLRMINQSAQKLGCDAPKP